MFINYDKSDNISDTTKYEDHFTGMNRLIAISKSGRVCTVGRCAKFYSCKRTGN
ncbi:MAG: DUF3427 domain-containing protein [Lachnospira sp.]